MSLATVPTSLVAADSTASTLQDATGVRRGQGAMRCPRVACGPPRARHLLPRPASKRARSDVNVDEEAVPLDEVERLEGASSEHRPSSSPAGAFAHQSCTTATQRAEVKIGLRSAEDTRAHRSTVSADCTHHEVDRRSGAGALASARRNAPSATGKSEGFKERSWLTIPTLNAGIQGEEVKRRGSSRRCRTRSPLPSPLSSRRA